MAGGALTLKSVWLLSMEDAVSWALGSLDRSQHHSMQALCTSSSAGSMSASIWSYLRTLMLTSRLLVVPVPVRVMVHLALLSYWVCEKTDGVRVLLLVRTSHACQEVYVVSQKTPAPAIRPPPRVQYDA
jgi:hypothetical protein